MSTSRCRLVIPLLVLVTCASTPPSRPTSLHELTERMTHFYDHPDPAFVATMIRAFSQDGVLDQPESLAPILGFVATAAQRHPDAVAEWSRVVGSLPASHRDFLWTALWMADVPQARDALRRAREQHLIAAGMEFIEEPPRPLQELEVQKPSDLDLLWGAFFASGDTVYVRPIVAVLDVTPRGDGHPMPGGRLVERDVVHAAEWSLASNAKQHRKVLEFCRDTLEGAAEPLATRLQQVVAQAEAGKPQWRAGGVDVPDERWRRSDGQLGAMLVVTDQYEEFVEAWKKPAAPGYAPSIERTLTTSRGGVVDTVILFSGCAAGATGTCDCEADFATLKPDGSIYAAQSGVPVWKGAPPPDRNLQLSDGRLRMRIEDHDPLGTYRIKVLIRDVVAKRQVALEWDLEVVPSKP